MCALLLILPANALAQTPQRDTLPVVHSLHFEGNEFFSDGDLQRAIVTRSSGCRSFLLVWGCSLGIKLFQRVERLDPRELRTDLARIRVFYFRRGFRRAEVDTSLVRVPGFVHVTFSIREGDPVEVREIGVAGLGEILDSADVVSKLGLEAGDPFSELTLAASTDSIRRQLRNRGYAQAEVLPNATIPSDDSLGAHVVLQVYPGPFARIGKIKVEGAAEIDTADVIRLAGLHLDAPYRERDLIRSQRNLYSAGMFQYVDVAPELTAADSIIDVRLRVIEANLKDVQVGLGLTTDECVQVEAGWTHRNFLGGTRRLELSGGLSNILTAQLTREFPCNQAGTTSDDQTLRDAFDQVNWRVRAAFQQPWFLVTNSTLGLGVFANRQSIPDIFARTSYGGDVALSQELAFNTRLTGFYRAERDRLEEGSADVLFCANFGICRPEDIAQLEEPFWLSFVGLKVTRSRATPELDPRGGYRWRVEAEHASDVTGSDWAYYRAVAELSWYRGVWAQTVLAVRVRGGWTEPIGSGIEGAELDEPLVHPLKRFYGGGASTVRGYGQNLLGPRVLLITDTTVLTDPNRPGVPCDVSPDRFTGSEWECDPSRLSSSDFDPRPVGGLLSLIGNVELRFPLFRPRWGAAVFFDLGQIWESTDAVERVFDDLSWSPGLGVRYLSPVGPLRLDVGYNTGASEVLPVVTQRPGTDEIVRLTRPFMYDPFDNFFSRLQLHFSIGQAF